jgi:hypothetical protein
MGRRSYFQLERQGPYSKLAPSREARVTVHPKRNKVVNREYI